MEIMLTNLRSSSSGSQPDAHPITASGRWSGMIPIILNLGSRESDDEFDLAELNELFAMGVIGDPDDEGRPQLSLFGWAVYEYLTRL